MLNNIGFTNDTIVQINHLLHRKPVFRFESHANHIACYADSAVRAYWVGLYNKALICGFAAFLLFIHAWRALVMRPITATSRVVSNHVLYVIGHTIQWCKVRLRYKPGLLCVMSSKLRNSCDFHWFWPFSWPILLMNHTSRWPESLFSDSDYAPVPKFLKPVSSEISDLRIFWPHAMCACTEQYYTYQMRWENWGLRDSCLGECVG